MSFDPQTFLNTQFDEVSDQRIPFPAGDYLGTIEKVDAASGKVSKPGPNQGKDWYRMEVTFRPVGAAAEEAAKAVGLQGIPTIRYSIMLNLDDNGKLLRGPNENPNLGKLLSAVNLNGNNWMPSQLMGQSCTIRVAHSSNSETGEPYANIVGVAPAA